MFNFLNGYSLTNKKNAFKLGNMFLDSESVHHILQKFNHCAPVFIALGDEARQKLIIDIANAGVHGLNVTDLSAKSNLSRPAISHHLKVLKDSGLIKPHKIGTQIFYKLSLKENLQEIEALINSMQAIIKKIEAAEASIL